MIKQHFEAGSLPQGAMMAFDGNNTIVKKADGTYWGWGKNDGEFLMTYDRRPLPIRLDLESFGFIKLSLGSEAGYGLKADGTVWGWGFNRYGELGFQYVESFEVPVQISGLEDVVDVAAGKNYVLCLRKDGSVFALGRNNHGQLGDGRGTDAYEPVEVSGFSDKVVSIWSASSGDHSFALTADGHYWGWGSNHYRQLGGGELEDILAPEQTISFSGFDVRKLTQSAASSYVLLESGVVIVWGRNDYGQLGSGHTNDINHPAYVWALDDVVDIAAQETHAIVLHKDGTVSTFGSNTHGELGDGTTTNSSTPIKVQGMTDIVAVGCSAHSSYALRSDGSLWGWGYYAGSGQVETFRPTLTTYLWEDNKPAHVWVEAQIGGGTDLRATALPSEFEARPVMWSSSNESIVTVDSEGIATGVTQGAAYVTAATYDGLHRATIGVLSGGGNIRELRVEMKLRPGESGRLATTDVGHVIAPDVVWASADASVATVDAHGLVTATGAGVTTVTATTLDRDLLGTVHVRVLEA